MPLTEYKNIATINRRIIIHKTAHSSQYHLPGSALGVSIKIRS
ncbi:hypothetical protein HMPREF0758_3471 [Serratia odorifera DSM 4582]|uniref:Uncharacterized protein n=1 Tax=Serratia odorifera DSM 4582 TaxID=667129 RepID=D4E5M1_SEROD|nr:hypothetical protein HMPREF0758_3471 [Serratia odorifera DSM 4582]